MGPPKSTQRQASAKLSEAIQKRQDVSAKNKNRKGPDVLCYASALELKPLIRKNLNEYAWPSHHTAISYSVPSFDDIPEAAAAAAAAAAASEPDDIRDPFHLDWKFSAVF